MSAGRFEEGDFRTSVPVVASLSKILPGRRVSSRGLNHEVSRPHCGGEKAAHQDLEPASVDPLGVVGHLIRVPPVLDSKLHFPRNVEHSTPSKPAVDRAASSQSVSVAPARTHSERELTSWSGSCRRTWSH